MTYSTYNPADKSAWLALTGGNLTVTAGSTVFAGVRGDLLQTSGKFYVEWSGVSLHPETLIWSPNILIGIANINWLLSNRAGDTDSAAWGALFGNAAVNGVSLATIGSWTDGETLQMAVDLDINRIWWAKNCGNWNNAGILVENPALGLGGYDISAITSGGIYIATSLNDWVGDSITLNAGASAWICTPPAGFSGWAPPPPPPPPPAFRPYPITVSLIPARVGRGGADL